MPVLRNISIPSQGIHQNLCWASVTVGICDYLDGTQLTLQAVTATCLPFCRGDLNSDFCDVSWQLQDALRSYSHAAHALGRALTFTEVMDQISNRQTPIGIMISFPDDVNHYCVIKGFADADGKEELILLDPSQPSPVDMVLTLASLLNSDGLGAPWTDTCVLN